MSFKDFQSSSMSVNVQDMIRRETKVTCKYLKAINNKLIFIKYLVF